MTPEETERARFLLCRRRTVIQRVDGKVVTTALTPPSGDWFEDGEHCEMCGRARRLVLDHCHDTGLLRGWLCQSCNVMEGRSGDSLIFRFWRERAPVLAERKLKRGGRDRRHLVTNIERRSLAMPQLLELSRGRRPGVVR